MNKLNKIEPVIELNPWIHEKDIEIINGENYSQFKNRLLKSHGICEKNSLKNSIKITELSATDLEGIIKIELIDYIEEGLDSDKVFSFDGGLVLDIDKNLMFSHSVGTGKISHFYKWSNFLKDSPENWEEIWIGRPWLHGRIRSGFIQITDYHDETIEIPKNDNSQILYQFELVSFKQELDKAKSLIDNFRVKIEECLKNEENILWRELSTALIEN